MVDRVTSRQIFIKKEKQHTIKNRKRSDIHKLENVAITAMYCHLRPPDAIAIAT